MLVSTVLCSPYAAAKIAWPDVQAGCAMPAVAAVHIIAGWEVDRISPLPCAAPVETGA
jgi:hypothetical protein